MTEKLVEALESEVGKCISCGFCESVCPTLPAAGYDLWKGARGRVIMGKEVLSALSSGNTHSMKVTDSFYSCLDCYACLYVCPAGVNAGKVSHLSKQVIATGGLAKNENPIARMIVSLTMKYMNPLGVREECADWFAGLSTSPGSTDLLYTGNMFQLMAYTENMGKLRKRMGGSASAFMARLVSGFPALMSLAPVRKNHETAKRMDRSLRNIVSLLTAAGISFNYLGRDEPYPGTFIYDLGYTDEFREYARNVTDIFRKANVKRIITVDPHTYDLLKTVYPEFVEDFGFEVVHYLDLVSELQYQNSGERITFHEPCHFSLRKDSYDVPLTVLRKISQVDLPARSGKRTKCCGGPDELLFPDITGKVSGDRYGELDELNTDRIVTACPICFSNLNKGSKVVEIGDYLSDQLR